MHYNSVIMHIPWEHRERESSRRRICVRTLEAVGGNTTHDYCKVFDSDIGCPNKIIPLKASSNL